MLVGISDKAMLTDMATNESDMAETDPTRPVFLSGQFLRRRIDAYRRRHTRF